MLEYNADSLEMTLAENTAVCAKFFFFFLLNQLYV